VNFPRYIDEVKDIAEGFRYELCDECGNDLDRHEIRPDPLGHAHLFCTYGDEERCRLCGAPLYGLVRVHHHNDPETGVVA
jgi:hypothetical protein